MIAANEMTSTSGEVTLSAELLPHHKKTAWTHQLVLGCAINWRLCGFTNLPPLTSSSTELLFTAQHISSRNPWAAPSWLFTKQFDPESRHPDQPWNCGGGGWSLASTTTTQSWWGPHAQGQPQREAEDVILSHSWQFSIDLMQEQRVTQSISAPSLVRKGHLTLSTVPKVQTGSNDQSLPILKISTKWKTFWTL